jgi:hypothetical protein
MQHEDNTYDYIYFNDKHKILKEKKDTKHVNCKSSKCV